MSTQQAVVLEAAAQEFADATSRGDRSTPM
jgi:hypothetical protein